MSALWPTELEIAQDGRALTVFFEDGQCVRISAEKLRVESPSAEVQGHGPGQKITVMGKERVQILSLEEVGNYAVKIVFDDGHDTGIYTWDYLYNLGSA